MNLTLALFSFSISFQWSMLSVLLLPEDILRFVPDSAKALYLSWITGVGALVALVSQPWAGTVSDRWTGQWGRRRPLILLGTVVNGLGLAGMAGAENLLQYIAGFLVMDLGSNAAIGAYHGLWRDRVAAGQRGVLSGLVGFLSLLGYVGGLWCGGNLAAASIQGAYLAIMLVFSAGGLFTLILVRDPPALRDKVPHPSTSFRELFRYGWRRHPDFLLACLHRLVVLLGFSLVMIYLAYFLKDGLGMSDYLRATGTLGTAVILAAMAASVAAGRLSDRFGRKVPVIVAGVVMGLAVGFMGMVETFSAALAAGVVFGLAYGVFTAVDLALALDVLPSQATAARDMGIWHGAYQLARVIAPLLGGQILYRAAVFGNDGAGYSLLFFIAATFFWIGSGLIMRITSIR